MESDRRNDIGMKTTFGLMASVILILLGLFINAVWATANSGILLANENSKRISAVEVNIAVIMSSQKRTSDDIGEIKDIITRPYIKNNN